MSAEILTLPVVRVERSEPEPLERPIVVLLNPRTAARLRRCARDCRMTPDELAALLLEQILKPRRST